MALKTIASKGQAPVLDHAHPGYTSTERPRSLIHHRTEVLLSPASAVTNFMPAGRPAAPPPAHPAAPESQVRYQPRGNATMDQEPRPACYTWKGDCRGGRVPPWCRPGAPSQPRRLSHLPSTPAPSANTGGRGGTCAMSQLSARSNNTYAVVLFPLRGAAPYSAAHLSMNCPDIVFGPAATEADTPSGRDKEVLTSRRGDWPPPNSTASAGPRNMRQCLGTRFWRPGVAGSLAVTLVGPSMRRVPGPPYWLRTRRVWCRWSPMVRSAFGTVAVSGLIDTKNRIGGYKLLSRPPGEAAWRAVTVEERRAAPAYPRVLLVDDDGRVADVRTKLGHDGSNIMGGWGSDMGQEREATASDSCNATRVLDFHPPLRASLAVAYRSYYSL
ncbi:hypothetical protein BV20DRAFT_979969 [Pilatotrama ljubarskyi]|nr:hypothetical protein BV20DRAFT_979969 [Pilatotrama ljubarskyi]